MALCKKKIFHVPIHDTELTFILQKCLEIGLVDWFGLVVCLSALNTTTL